MTSRADPGDRAEIVVYEAPEGDVGVDVRLERETVWLSLTLMADPFGTDKSVMSRYLRNVFTSDELECEATVARSATVQVEGGRDVVFLGVSGATVSWSDPTAAPRLGDTAMALALLIAESDPSQKDLMIRFVLNLLGDEAR
jgi:hypothetical protein